MGQNSNISQVNSISEDFKLFPRVSSASAVGCALESGCLRSEMTKERSARAQVFKFKNCLVIPWGTSLASLQCVRRGHISANYHSVNCYNNWTISSVSVFSHEFVRFDNFKPWSIWPRTI